MALVLSSLLGMTAAVAHESIDRQIVELSRSIAADPQNAGLYLRRGEVHRVNREWAAAEADYEKSRTLEPTLALVDFCLGEMHIEAGRPERALVALDRFLARSPGDARGLAARARARALLGAHREAASDYTRSIAAYARDSVPPPDVYIQRARELALLSPLHTGDEANIGGARKLAGLGEQTSGASRTPAGRTAADVHVGRAQVPVRESSNAELRAEALRGLEEGLAALGRPVTLEIEALDLELAFGRFDAALARVDRLEATYPDSISWLTRCAEILEKAHRPAEARRAFLEVRDAIAKVPAVRRRVPAIQRTWAEARLALERLDTNGSGREQTGSPGFPLHEQNPPQGGKPTTGRQLALECLDTNEAGREVKVNPRLLLTGLIPLQGEKPTTLSPEQGQQHDEVTRAQDAHRHSSGPAVHPSNELVTAVPLGPARDGLQDVGTMPPGIPSVRSRPSHGHDQPERAMAHGTTDQPAPRGVSSAPDLEFGESGIGGHASPAPGVASSPTPGSASSPAPRSSSAEAASADLVAALTRGPYLQMGTPASIVVRWSTSEPADSRVRYGASPGLLSDVADDALLTTHHAVTVTGLAADTQYYYSVGSSAATLAGGDAAHYFRTSPVAGVRRPVRIWVIGDSGTANDGARAVRDAYEAFTGPRYTDLWLMLGDNAYLFGTDSEYQTAVFNMYPSMLEKTVLWPTFGNHDGVSASSGTQTGPYYEIFTLPAAAEAGGVGSGTEAYYSFDYGNIHFICLNSQDVDRSPGSPMLTWLEQDLASTARDWIVAFWHHPPYSKGSHDSDTDPQLTEMRENALPILEDWGVDLVLGGHSHSYERSYLLDGHYGTSDTLTAAMKKDVGDGRTDGNGAYQKATAGPAPHEGAVYVVAGSSGQIGGGSLDHPAMYLSLDEMGSVVLDIEGDRMQAKFLDQTGAFRDHFTLVKNTSAAPSADFSASPTTGAVPLSVAFTDLSTTNTASWAWDLDGDGSSDTTEQQPARIYSTPGVYSVRLTAANAGGINEKVRTQYICASLGTPPLIADLLAALDRQTWTWGTLPAASHYEFLKGDLGALAASHGDFSVTLLSCVRASVAASRAGAPRVSSSLESPDPVDPIVPPSIAPPHAADPGSGSSVTPPHAVDPSVPRPGNGFYYIVRGIGLCGEPGTYDEGGIGQATPRDPGISASGVVCP